MSKKIAVLVTLAVGVLLLAGPPAGGAAQGGQKWAILVGIDKYMMSGITPLHCAVSDVRAVKKALIESAGFPEDHIFLYTSDSASDKYKPTKGNIAFGLDYIAQHARPGDSFVFHFSGHGVTTKTKKNYLLTFETDNRTETGLAMSSLRVEELNELITNIGATRKLLILDACRSDPSPDKAGSDNLLSEDFVRSVQIRAKNSGGGEDEVRAVFYACKEGCRSYEWPEKKQGFFSYYLVRGLRGDAKNTEGEVTLGSLKDYVMKKVNAASLKEVGKEQTPWLSEDGSGVWILAQSGGNPSVGKSADQEASFEPEVTEVVVSPQKAERQVALLEVTSEPAGAEVLVDGKSVGLTPFEAGDIPAGRHKVAVRLGGYRGGAREATMEKGKKLSFQFPLERVEQCGSLKITSSPPGAAVYLDNRRSGETDDQFSGIKPGSHTVILKKSGFRDYVAEVEVPEGGSGKISARLERESARPASVVVNVAAPPPAPKPKPVVVKPRKISSHPASSRPQQVAMGTMPSMITNAKDGSELILIPAGEFLMGSNDSDSEKPPHKVYLDAYYIGKYEVTNEQFARFVNETGYNAGGDWKKYYNSGTADHPVVCVSWNDAKAYCNWANLRLPTEAEWEKAARGTDGRKYPWGNEWDAERCNWWNGPKLSGMADISSGRGTLPVGSFSSGESPYGCLDMAGNVWEWCADWYGEKYYSQSPNSDPQGPSSGSGRVLRGGSWLNVDAILFRCANRDWLDPGLWDLNLGFRVSRSANTR